MQNSATTVRKPQPRQPTAKHESCGCQRSFPVSSRELGIPARWNRQGNEPRGRNFRLRLTPRHIEHANHARTCRKLRVKPRLSRRVDEDHLAVRGATTRTLEEKTEVHVRGMTLPLMRQCWAPRKHTLTADNRAKINLKIKSTCKKIRRKSVERNHGAAFYARDIRLRHAQSFSNFKLI